MKKNQIAKSTESWNKSVFDASVPSILLGPDATFLFAYFCTNLKFVSTTLVFSYFQAFATSSGTSDQQSVGSTWKNVMHRDAFQH